ncbi:MAG: hypothetical protein COU81_03250 [Candidatus Portnoybacteria bacterium CG10_big_fil_rev_8_21_14_0_10_36_7]|uniref:Phosphomannomutase/phosphoglucomutase n=1 Tax=Candidatus Portnoybacteria bacterium CG10_big_fil_rev_8_21_14_0_10_36_7 TaxID=1974812 RepID=A0A2M8KDI3_9BACT|nr:MAG: hypothetical protein COU81_03250 [Candidatus Portnoybacteria bacterium CG10_big_fil_rev_8_21_14_0_10_36_7]
MVTVKEKIFNQYDIRGKFPDEINEESSQLIGAGLVEFLKKEKLESDIIVGHDARLSSPDLSRSIIDGICRQGFNVINIGLCTTDCASFASGYLNLPAVMVTASHNPKEYNGFKFYLAGAKILDFKNGLLDIKNIINGNIDSSEIVGRVEIKNIHSEYIKYLQGFVDSKELKPLKIVVDVGNGAVAPFAEELFKSLPFEVVKLNFNMDGNFPGRGPNPTIHGVLDELKKKVLEYSASIGVAFDADGDRVVFVDDEAYNIPPSIIASWILESSFGANVKIIYDARQVKLIEEVVGRLKMVGIREYSGRSIIKRRMENDDADFAVEQSCHYYFKDAYYSDSGLIALLYVLKHLSLKYPTSASALAMPWRKEWVGFEENIVAKGQLDEKIKKIIEKYVTPTSSCKVLDSADRLILDCGDWYLNLRASNTEPVFRLNIEAKQWALLEEKMSEIKMVVF